MNFMYKMLRILLFLMAVTDYVTFLWVVMPCYFVDRYDRKFR